MKIKFTPTHKWGLALLAAIALPSIAILIGQFIDPGAQYSLGWLAFPLILCLVFAMFQVNPNEETEEETERRQW